MRPNNARPNSFNDYSEFFMKFKAISNLANLIVATILFSILTACAIFNSGAEATVHIRSANYLNPNIYGHSSPVVLTIYQLKAQYAFQQADYNALTNNSGKILGGDLIDKNTIEVRPNTQMKVSQPLSPNTQYLGIVAAYRNINNATWHKVVKIEQKKGSHPVLNLDLQSQGFNVRVEYKSNFL